MHDELGLGVQATDMSEGELYSYGCEELDFVNSLIKLSKVPIYTPLKEGGTCRTTERSSH